MELRKDYILSRWVIISEGRKNRPWQFGKEEVTSGEGVCYFCPGNEHLTPPEIGRLGNPWQIRWFPNKFPALEEKGNSIISTADRYFTYSDAYGRHEVLVETPEHVKQLSDLSVEEISRVLDIYCLRINELSKLPSTKYVCVFKNHGREAGTSIIHSHSQIFSLNYVPSLVEEEVAAAKSFGRCPYCEILQIEKQSYRRAFENNSFVAFTPYASRFNYEIWVFPKEHVKSITELDKAHLDELADIMKKILVKLAELKCSYNLFLHYAPLGEDLHFHIEICPRIATWGGFELSTESSINSVSPEAAAAFYRGESI